MRSGRLWSVGRQAASTSTRRAGRRGQREQLAGERAAADDERARRSRRVVRPGQAALARRSSIERAGRLGGDAGIAAVGVGADRRAELLVQRRAADQHDVVVADAAVLERLR